MQAKAPEATQAQGKPAAGAPLRGISLEDRGAQAKELAAFWARQAQLLNDKLHEDKTAQAAHGLTTTEEQGKQEEGPAPAGPTQGAGNEDEDKEVPGQIKPGQGEIVKDEIAPRSVDTKQKTECKAEGNTD